MPAPHYVHLNPQNRNTNLPAPIHIGKNVWIGANATVLPGVTIGDDAVIAGAEVINREKVDFVLAVGGGSVIDCVKIMVAAAKAPKDLWEMEFYDGVMPTEGTPFGVVLTLSGTGVEMS